MFTCTTCDIAKPAEEFYKARNSRGHRAQCKDCCKAYYKEWSKRPQAKEAWNKASKKYYRSSTDVAFARKLKKYGLTEEEFRKIEERDSVCAICGAGDKLVIDHCHSSNEVRGIICDPCNRGLGAFRDNVKSLEKAIKYLLRGSEKVSRGPHKPENRSVTGDRI